MPDQVHQQPIFLHSCTVRDKFQAVIRHLEQQPSNSPIDTDVVSDTWGRFMVWAGNLGAALHDPMSNRSLDQRLETSPEVSKIICQNLVDLCEAIDDCEYALIDCNEIPAWGGPRALETDHLATYIQCIL